MKLLENPEVRYGPLPEIQGAKALLESRPDLQAYEGAMEYLELHLDRVKDCYGTIEVRGRGIFAWLQRVKARQAFTNTTRALRMIMVFHQENPFVLNQMALRIQEELGATALELHYQYLLRLLNKLGSREAGALLKN